MNKIIVFYDDECGLCHHSIAWLYKKDLDKRFYFSPLTGETSKELLEEKYREMNTVVLYESGRVSIRAEAVFNALKYLHGFWKVVSYFPALIFNPIYHIVALLRKNIPIRTLHLPKERCLP